MSFRSFTTAFLAAVTASLVFQPAYAGKKTEIPFTEGETVTLDEFDGVGITGGGDVTISYSDSWTVRVISGGEDAAVYMKNGSLTVGCKKRRCQNNVKRVFEITAPALENVAITGGGIIEVGEGFAPAPEVNIAITGGGRISAYNLPAEEVNVAITGGGSITVTAEKELNAAIVGGGSIRYQGDPEISKSVIGGGSIKPR